MLVIARKLRETSALSRH